MVSLTRAAARRSAMGAPSASPRPTIVLAVSGSLETYQAAEVARLLVEAGAHVIPVMTRAAEELLGARTLSGLTGERVHGEQDGGEIHGDLARRADVVVLAPATADLLGRLASGGPDDVVTAIASSSTSPVIAAPAMDAQAWADPAVQRHLAHLTAGGRIEIVGAVAGPMAEPAVIAAAALARAARRDLAGLRVVVTAGPTLEDLDPVRFLGNRSSGKMGFAVAARAAARGAAVTLIAGPVALPTPFGVRRVDVRGALSMRAALWAALGPDLSGADALIMIAAVADYRPAEESPTKRKRKAENLTLELVPNPDLLAEIGAARSRRIEGSDDGGSYPALVGFAVETDTDAQVVAYARGKLEQKGVDLMVANHAGDAFGKDDNRATLVDRRGAEALSVLPKPDLADRILDRLPRLCHR